MRRKLLLFLTPIVCILLETGLAAAFSCVITNQPVRTTLFTDVVMAVFLCILYYLRKRMSSRELQGQNTVRDLKKPAVRIGLLALIQIPVWLICQLAATYIIVNFPETYAMTSSAFGQASSWEYVLLVVFFAPVVEELLFRGLFYGNYEQLFGFVPAALISAVVFAWMHGNLPQGVVTLVLGLFYACVVRQTGTVWSTVILHMIANMMDTMSGIISIPAFCIEPWFWGTALGVILAGLVMWMIHLVRTKAPEPPAVVASDGVRRAKAADDAL